MNEKSAGIRVLIENANKRLSAWFDFPITPQELNDKIGVPVEKFNDCHPSYKVNAVELPDNITFDELNKLVKGSSSLAVEIVNSVTDKKDMQYVPVDVKKLAEHTGYAPNLGCYKINKAFITIDTIDEMNRAFAPEDTTKAKSDIRVQIKNWCLEEETGQEHSDWFTFPISPQELNKKIGVPLEEFENYYPMYEVVGVELPDNITIKQLNQLVKAQNALSVEITNTTNGKKHSFAVPVDIDALKWEIGNAPIDGYKITSAQILIDSIKEMNQAFSPAKVVKVNEVSNKSGNQYQKLKKGFVLSRKDIKKNAQTIAHNKPEQQQNKNRSKNNQVL
ncbi:MULTISPECIES: hypothetical protein [unclassified Ruminococcus]|uniref:hypothetical protein n=1 Tax=unclassified Ruminococcus TaxID=2608920 RepID=UPI00210E894A|nr:MULTISPECIES: hypothetical protein [unclassified Ruminococcus]MCQ4021739.1 hypothetical protein [Ruminococcus sp. zg-924]MCQ4114183.1 hypothetical protein [Ruminococcus sp. zg-921]